MLSTGISVAHSNDAIARTFQEPSPRLVVASLRFSIVHVPLELDHNPFTGTIQIHNKAVQYVLSPKLEPEDSAVAQQRPGVTLSWRRVVAQLAGARKSLGRAETTKRIHLPERAAQRNDLRNQNPAERSEKKLTFRSPSPGGRGGQGVRTGLLDKVGALRRGRAIGLRAFCFQLPADLSKQTVYAVCIIRRLSTEYPVYTARMFR